MAKKKNKAIAKKEPASRPKNSKRKTKRTASGRGQVRGSQEPKVAANENNTKESHQIDSGETRFWAGKLYHLFEHVINPQKPFNNLGPDDLLEQDPDPFNLSRGNIFENERAKSGQPNDIVIFDINHREYWDCSFRGFLYPDKTVVGKIHYVASSGLKGESFKGFYQRRSASEIILVGHRIYDDGAMDVVCIHLKRDRIRKRP